MGKGDTFQSDNDVDRVGVVYLIKKWEYFHMTYKFTAAMIILCVELQVVHLWGYTSFRMLFVELK